MEFKQTFRKCSVVESGSFEKGSYYSFVITFFHQPRNIFSGCTLTSYIQVVEESKIPDSVEECLLKLCSRFVILCGQKLEQILEHTTGSARSRNKLHDDFIRILISIPCSQICFLIFCVRSQYAFFYGSGSVQFQIRKTRLEASQLFCYLRLRDAFLGKQLFVLCRYHNIYFY